MKLVLIAVVFVVGFGSAHALVISEVMSNPTGDDSGREWVEIYNDTALDVDISSMTISIKGATAVVTTPLQGGTTLPPNGYAIIASVVSGQTKFLQDYPTYNGPLFKSSISLVNTGVTSIDIKLNGSIAASLPSYTASKEGTTLSYIGGSYVTGTPTPGADNQVVETAPSGGGGTTATTTDTQVTLPQMTPPTADIIIYLPTEKVVVAGASSDFSVFSQTRAGKAINDLRYTWAFGDGGQSTGSSTSHRYEYSGRYITQVEALNSTTMGSGRMLVRVVPPDIIISGGGMGKYGAYIDIKNPNTYDLDLSQWMLVINDSSFSFPKNTLLPAGEMTRFSGNAMGFAHITIGTSTPVKILFPSLEEVTRYTPQQDTVLAVATTTKILAVNASVKPALHPVQKVVLGVSSSTPPQPISPRASKLYEKDTRLVAWIKSVFHW